MDRGAQVYQTSSNLLSVEPEDISLAHQAFDDIAGALGLHAEKYLTALEKEGPQIWLRLKQRKGNAS